MFGQIGPMEIIVVLVIALVVLGPKKLPEAGKSLGKGIREFKDTMSGITGGSDDDDALRHEARAARRAPEPAPAPEPAATAEPASSPESERVV